jgi:hypothetical protein
MLAYLPSERGAVLKLNNLIGLQYGWGHKPGDGSGMTDCFQLCLRCTAPPRTTHDHSDMYAWVYEQYDEATFTVQRLVRFLLTSGTRTNDPRAR